MTRRLALSVAVLAALASPAAKAQQVGRGHLVSMSTATMLCAGTDGLEMGPCPVAASRVRFTVLRQQDRRIDLEIQIAGSGLCLGTSMSAAAGARVVQTPCGAATWRYDVESLRLDLDGLCLEAGTTRSAPALLAPCAADHLPSPRQEWAFAGGL